MKSVRILFCLIVILPLALSLTGCGKHSLTMAVTGSGTTDPPVGATTYKDKETVTMTAAAAAGWTFDHWEGDVTGSANPATCQISADMHVTAVFVQQQVTLTVTAEGSGSANPSVGTHSYAVGTAVMIAATAAAGWRFDHWEGDLTGAANPASLTMDADKSVKAVFVQDGQNYTLTTAVSGTGTVDPSAGTHSYASGASVTVTATAGSGWHFRNWSGDLSGWTNPASITMSANKSVTAVFEQDLQNYTLTTAVSGTGTVDPAPGTYSYASGASVTVTAAAGGGWSFDHWTGDLSDSTNPVTITMNATRSVTAVFVQSFTLTTAVTGQGSVGLNPSGGTYNASASVTVTATAASGWHFDHWEGDLSGSDNPATLTMDANKTVTAVFVENEQFTLTVNIRGDGLVDLDPAGGVYDAGTNVTLPPVAPALWQFDHWEGALTGKANPATLTMDADKTVTAVFVFVSEPSFDTVPLFDNHNDAAASAGAAATTEVTLDKAALVAVLSTWHAAGAETSNGGDISITMPDGTVLGPWHASAITSDTGTPTLWRATPNTPLPAGTYSIVDSQPETWIQNTDSSGAGFTCLDGVWFGAAANADIGTAGGTLAADGFLATVPAGALTESATLSVSRMDPLEENDVAAQYILTGLPEEHGTIEVEVSLTGALADDAQVFVATPGYQPSPQQTQFSREPVPATFGGGKARFQLPGSSAKASPKAPLPPPMLPMFIYIEGETAEFYTDHFCLNVPPTVVEQPFWPTLRPRIETLGLELEEAYDFLTKKVGLLFILRTTDSWPMCISLSWRSDDVIGMADRSYLWGPNADSIDYNLYKLREIDEPGQEPQRAQRIEDVRAAAVHELFHVLQYNYVRKRGGAGDQDWMMEASSIWSEWPFCGPATHYPDVAIGNEGRLPLNGLLDATNTECRNNGNKRNSQSHEYASGLFMRYLVEAHGNIPTTVGALWQDLHNGGTPIHALDMMSGMSWRIDWQAFCRKLYGGELSTWFDDPVRTRRLSAQWIGAQVTDSRPSTLFNLTGDSQLKQWQYSKGPLPPVSATLFQIKVNYMPAKPEDQVVYFFPEGLTADTAVQVRWYKMEKLRKTDFISSVLGEVGMNSPLTVDLSTISGLPAPPFMLQMIVTNKSATTAYPDAGVRWSFGAESVGLQSMKNLMMTVDTFFMGPVQEQDWNYTVSCGLTWKGMGFSGHYENQDNGDTVENWSGTMHPSGKWIESFTWTMTNDGEGISVCDCDDGQGTVAHTMALHIAESMKLTMIPYNGPYPWGGYDYSLPADKARPCIVELKYSKNYTCDGNPYGNYPYSRNESAITRMGQVYGLFTP